MAGHADRAAREEVLARIEAWRRRATEPTPAGAGTTSPPTR